MRLQIEQHMHRRGDPHLDVTSPREKIPKLVERHGHDTIGHIECLLNAVACHTVRSADDASVESKRVKQPITPTVVNVDVDVQNPRMIPADSETTYTLQLIHRQRITLLEQLKD